MHSHTAHGRAEVVGNKPLAVFTSFWQHRTLVLRLAKRKVEARHRGSFLGLAWSVLTPLLMLAVYTFVFSVVFHARWEVPQGGKGQFAMVLFAGLIMFSLFAECVNRAPGLILENVSYVKKVVFPLEILPWVTLLSALFNIVVSLAVLLVAYVVLLGVPEWTVIFLPLVLLPLVLLIMGVSWFLASVGVFVRDLRQIVGVLTTMLLFLSPIFCPVSAIPEGFRTYIYLIPLTFVIEQTRAALLWGNTPNWLGLAVYSGLAWGVAWVGFLWFAKTKKGFADVV